MANMAPSLSSFGPSVTLAESDAPQPLDADVTFADAEGNFDGGMLTVSGLLAEDRIGIRDQGEIGASGAGVLYGGTIIGDFSGGVGGTFTVLLNAAATSAAVDALIENLTYANVSDVPTASRTLRLNVTDTLGADLAPDGPPVFNELAVAADPYAGIDVGLRSAPSFADIDGDGDQDAVVGGLDSVLHTFRNNGDGSFTELLGPPNPFSGWPSALAWTPTFVDLDGDGDLDLVGGEYRGSLRTFRNNGGGSFTELFGTDNPFNGIGGTGHDYSAPDFADMDGDGDEDLVLGQASGALQYFRRDGGAFIQLTGDANPFDGVNVGDRSMPAIVDLDGDGDLDAVIGNGAGAVRVFRSDGGAFTELAGLDNPFAAIALGGFSAPTFTDVDGDGDLDLVTGELDGIVRAFENATPSGRAIAVNVTGSNDAPAVANLAADVVYAENGPHVTLSNSLVLSDADDTNLEGASVRIIDGLTAGDSLSVDGAATGTAGAISWSCDASSGTLSFTGSAPLADYQILLRQVAFETASDEPGPSRTISWTVNDGDEASTIQTSHVGMTEMNDAPIIDLDSQTAFEFDTSADYLEGDGPTLIAPRAIVSDPDLPANYAGYVLTVEITDSGTADDRLDIVSIGTGPVEVNVVGGDVFHEGVQVATFTGGIGVTPLVISFDEDASAGSVERVTASIAFSNSSNNPSTLERRVVFVIDDGAASDSSATATAMVGVTAINEVPELAGLQTSVTFDSNDLPSASFLLDGEVTLSDGDGNFDRGFLLVTGLLEEDQVAIRDQGSAAGQIGVSGSDVTYGGVVVGMFEGGQADTFGVVFNAAATVEAVEALIENLTYANTSTTPTSSRTLVINVVDGAGADLGLHLPPVDEAQFAPHIAAAGPFDSVDIEDYSAPAFVDLDSDGDLDLVVGEEDSVLHAFRNEGGVFIELDASANPFDNLDLDSFTTPDFVDIDGDADLDLVVGGSEGGLQLFGNEEGAFVERTDLDNVLANIDVGYRATPAFADFDGDGDLDLAVGSFSGPLSAFESDGGTFTELFGVDNPFDAVNAEFYSSFNAFTAPAFVDLDGDGDLDLVVGENDGTLRAFRNDDGAFSALAGSEDPFEGVSLDWGSKPAFHDFDNDGDLDAVVGQYDGSLRLLENGPPHGQPIIVNVAAINDVPMADDLVIDSSEDTPHVTILLTAADADDDGSGTPPTFRLADLPDHGILYTDYPGVGGTPVVAGTEYPANFFDVGAWDRVFVFVPDPDWGGTTGFDFTVTDSEGATSAPATATLNLAPQADAPRVDGNVHDRPDPEGPATNATGTTGGEDGPALAGLDDGRSIIVWQTGPFPSTIRARLYDADGNPEAAAFAVTESGGPNEFHPSVAGRPDGSFAVSWVQDGADTGSGDVHTAFYVAGSTTPVLVTTTAASLGGREMDPMVTALGAGYVVTWAVENGTAADHYAHLYSTVGVGTGAPFLVSAGGDPGMNSGAFFSPPNHAIVAVGDDGAFAIVTVENDGTLVSTLVDATGVPATPVAVSSGGGSDPSIAALPQGGFVVAWTNDDVLARVFDADGHPLTGELPLAATGFSEFNPQVGALPDGRFVVAWVGYNSTGPSLDIFTQVFTADGLPSSGGPVAVTSTGTSSNFPFLPIDEIQPTITMLSDGRFTVGWMQNFATGGTAHDVFVRSYDPGIGVVSGFGGVPIALPTTVSLTDVDGSEIPVEVRVGGLPEGFTLDVGGREGGDPAGDWIIDRSTIAQADFLDALAAGTEELMITAPGDYAGPLTLQIVATSQESGNPSQTAASAIALVPLVISEPTSIDLNGTDDGPDSFVAFAEGGPGVAIAPWAVIAGGGGANLAGATLTIDLSVNGEAEDALVLVGEGTSPGQIGVTGTTVIFGGVAIGSVTGGGATPLVVAFEAAATLEAVQAVLRRIFFENGSDTPSELPRTIGVSFAYAGGLAPPQADATVQVTAIDDPATATDDSAEAVEGSTKIIDVLANDSDPDSTPSIVTVDGQTIAPGATVILAGSGAWLTLEVDGRLRYDTVSVFDFLPAADSGASNLSATDTFTYGLSDGSAATVTVNVTGVDSEDVLTDGPGNDAMHAGRDNDMLIGGAGGDLLDGGSGTDTVSYAHVGAQVFVNLMTAGQQNTKAGGLDTLVAIENVIGGDGPDTLRGSDVDNRLEGGSGSDRLFGRLGDDVLIGGSGNDRLGGERGDDMLQGGTGDDLLDGGLGTDTASYADIGDQVFVNLMTAGQQDTKAGGLDILVSIENLIGGDGPDALRGSDVDNRLEGGNGSDRLYGRLGDDVLIGGSGNDSLGGERGNDTIQGGSGNDLLEGGRGIDQFIFDTALDAASNVDRILDFTRIVDQIVLENAIFTGLASGQLAAGALAIGSMATTAGHRIIYNPTTGALLFDADGSGGGFSAVQFASLDNQPASLSASDFLVI